MAKQTDLSKVPDEALYAEIGRRRSAARTIRGGGRAITCKCGTCAKCKKREAMREYRKTVARRTLKTAKAHAGR